MVKKFGNNIIKYGTNVFMGGQNLVLQFQGATFPVAVDNNDTARFQLYFSAPATIAIDYGNGVVNNYSTTFISTGVYTFKIINIGSTSAYTPQSYETPSYSYPDNLSTANRVVTISFNRGLLFSISIALMRLANQDLIFGLSRYPNLKTFDVHQVGNGGYQTGAISNINWENALASKITTVYINNCFNSNSIFYGTIPSFFFSMPIQQLSVGDQGMASKTFAQSNLAGIYQLASTLTYLTIQGVGLTDNNYGDGALPANFNTLTKLTSLSIVGTVHTIIPAVINTIVSLTTLTFAFNGAATDYGDISGLVNLTNLTVEANPNFTTSIPSYFSSFTKLKTLDFRSCYRTQIRIDTAISNIYAFIVANAAKTGTSANPFRSMTMMIGIFATGDGTAVPSGTYQQPAGYVQGSSNGSPATSLEMVWVMVNQYSHTWTYRVS
jgi:hypothetical protein